MTSSMVVCPTEYGGHIEHAADIALALTHRTTAPSVLVTRSGAAKYLDMRPATSIRILEVLPPRRTTRNPIVRSLQQIFDLCVEHIRVRKAIREIQPSVVVFESPRYPFPRLLQVGGRSSRFVLFLHNAKPHYHSSLRQKFQQRIEAISLHSMDRITVHGEPQKELIQRRTSTPVSSVPLPFGSLSTLFGERVLEAPPELPDASKVALCLGDIRRNKGVETAIRASVGAEWRLVIAGLPESPEYGSELAGLAASSPGTVLIQRFLEKSEYEYLIANSAVIVLPYSHFDAQSGVLAHALAHQQRIVASRLPSLVDQGGGSWLIEYVDPGDIEDLRRAVTRAYLELAPRRIDVSNVRGQWLSVADAILD